MSPAEDQVFQIVGSTNRFKLGYRIDQFLGQDTTLDTGDTGAINFARILYYTFT